MLMLKTLEELRSHIWDLRQGTLEQLAERLEELSTFQLGSYYGEIMVYDEILSALRDMIKYGDDQ